MVESAASKDYLNVGKMEALQGVLANGKSNVYVGNAETVYYSLPYE